MVSKIVGQEEWRAMKSADPNAATTFRAVVQDMGVRFSDNKYVWVGFPEEEQCLVRAVWESSERRVPFDNVASTVGPAKYALMEGACGSLAGVVVELEQKVRQFGITVEFSAFTLGTSPVVISDGRVLSWVVAGVERTLALWREEADLVSDTFPVGVDCEGELERGNVALLQLAIGLSPFAEASSSSSPPTPPMSLPPPLPTLLFHLDAMDEATRKDAVSFLSRFFNHPAVVVVMHDARADAIGLAALDPPIFLRRMEVFDTQVALSVVSPQSPSEAGLNDMLLGCHLPQNEHKSAMHVRFDTQGDDVWGGDLDDNAVAYAAADVDHLVSAYVRLTTALETKRTNSADVVARSRARLSDPLGALPSSTHNEASSSSERNVCLVRGKPSLAPGSAKEELLVVDAVCKALPLSVGAELQAAIARLHHAGGDLVELILDIGRPVGLRSSGGHTDGETEWARGWMYLTETAVLGLRDVARVERALVWLSLSTSDSGSSGSGGEKEEVQKAVENLDLEAAWTSDNRMGIGGTLHRISRAQRGGMTTMLTVRIGRHYAGNAMLLLSSQLAAVVESVQSSAGSHSILLVGPPCSGKTTLLRDVVAGLGASLGPAVVVVDTSGEIGGSGLAPHPSLGLARRAFVDVREHQYQDLLEVVQNHTPGVVVVDEVRDTREATSVATISQRGVCVIATAHGNSLGDVVRNRALRDLVGGVAEVTLSAGEAAKASSGGRKAARQRSGPSPFATIVQVSALNEIRIVADVNGAIDAVLASGDDASIEPFIRTFRLSGDK